MWTNTPTKARDLLLRSAIIDDLQDFLSRETGAFLVSYFLNRRFNIIKINIASERLWNQQVLVLTDHGNSTYDVLIDDNDMQSTGVVFLEGDVWYMAFSEFSPATTCPYGYNPMMIAPLVTMRRMFSEARKRYLSVLDTCRFFEEEGYICLEHKP